MKQRVWHSTNVPSVAATSIPGERLAHRAWIEPRRGAFPSVFASCSCAWNSGGHPNFDIAKSALADHLRLTDRALAEGRAKGTRDDATPLRGSDPAP